MSISKNRMGIGVGLGRIVQGVVPSDSRGLGSQRTRNGYPLAVTNSNFGYFWPYMTVAERFWGVSRYKTRLGLGLGVGRKVIWVMVSDSKA